MYFAIRPDSTTHFYNETNQSVDPVLDIFIRTNHSGTPLAFSDLLMSISVTTWEKDARHQIVDLVKQVRFGTDMEFSINHDFVLKTALMLSDSDMRFKDKNFTEDQVAKINQEWDDIKICILEVFRLIRSFGLNDATLRAKNTAIPIAYYLFHKGRNKKEERQGLYADINNSPRYEEERKRIRQWLHISLLKDVFGGQVDALLTNLRKIIRSGSSSSAGFPLDEIVTEYRSTAQGLDFDDDFIDRLLKTQKDNLSCFSILALLFPDLDFIQSLDIDHLHPAASFGKKRLNSHVDFGNPGGRSFYENPENWNGIANLYLLNSSKNKSKQDMPLEQWLVKQSRTKAEDLLIPTGVDLSFGAFEPFINARAASLKQKLGLLAGKNGAVGAQRKVAIPDGLKTAKSAPTKLHQNMNTFTQEPPYLSAIRRESAMESLRRQELERNRALERAMEPFQQMERIMGSSRRQPLEISRAPGMPGATALAKEFASANQGWQELLKQITPSNRIVESLHGVHQSWLGQLGSLQRDLSSLGQLGSLQRDLSSLGQLGSLQRDLSSLGQLGSLQRDLSLLQISTKLTLTNASLQLTATEQIMAGIDFETIGKRFQIELPVISRLESSIANATASYGRWVESLCQVSDITRLPAFILPGATLEIFTTSLAIKTLRPLDERDEEDTETEIQLDDELERGESFCIALLRQVDPELVRMYTGARDALLGNNPDRARHALISFRGLWDHLLRRLAPDELVKVWIPGIANQKGLSHDGKPTRHTRVRYICRELNNGSLTEFLIHDTQALVKLIELCNLIHELDIGLTDEQLRAILLKNDSWLMYILQIAAENFRE